MKHFLRLRDISKDEIMEILKLSFRFKKGMRSKCLKGKTIALLFEKPSTRTRVSLEVAIFHLGGWPLALSSNEIQLSRDESLEDTARTLSRYVDGIVFRTSNHERIEIFSRYSSKPVINALTNSFHPLQTLADVFTIIEFKKRIEGIIVCYIGDVNNVCRSWIEGSEIFGYSLRICSPEKYIPPKEIIDELKGSGDVSFYSSPEDAAKGADVLATDVWVSMGMEEEKNQRIRDFEGFTINEKIVSCAKEHPLVLHCLPAHKNYEISEEVFERFSHIIFQEAENRLHTSKGVLKWIFG